MTRAAIMVQNSSKQFTTSSLQVGNTAYNHCTSIIVQSHCKSIIVKFVLVSICQELKRQCWEVQDHHQVVVSQLGLWSSVSSFFYIILYHCKVDLFPQYGSPFFFYYSIGWQGGARVVHEVTNRFKPVKTSGWQGGARVTCSSMGVGASVQLTTE